MSMIADYQATSPAEVRDKFNAHGFVTVPNVLPSDELAELRAKVQGVLDGTVQPPDVAEHGEFQVQLEPRVRDRADVPRHQKVRVVFHMAHRHPYFKQMARSERILDIIEAAIGPDIRFYTDQLFVKPPRHGSEVPWHQDSAYWPNAEPRLVSCWVAIDNVTIENGCVRFIPGSHRSELPHDEIVTDNPNKITTRSEYVDAAQEVPVEIEAGSVCIHHSLTVHRSLPNESEHYRRGWILIYMPADLKFHKPWDFDYGFDLVRTRA